METLHNMEPCSRAVICVRRLENICLESKSKTPDPHLQRGITKAELSVSQKRIEGASQIQSGKNPTAGKRGEQ
ncbi:hypothetical protein Pcinc_001584 [Petrolisthes cinctipes]|uniref:Uncharacterized protein n=1 Tax=Petrolisthes cinctipes TaxID=88211 RepID=A0AAE1L3S0_PETCI|nr:hypothetical protein Pcinc_001584 [Petrolisthes cinctipes]